MEKDFTGTTIEEKLKTMFWSWLCPDKIKFTDSEMQKAYQARVNRITDVIQLKVPDRVPVIPSIGFFPAYFAGITPQAVMYDYDKLYFAWKKYLTYFQPDMFSGLGNPCPGRVFELLDYKMYRWPGHGLPEDMSYQCVEREYMEADEYNALIQDPSDFWLRIYLPRVFGALQPMKLISTLVNIIEMPSTGPNLIAFGRSDVQAALKSISAAGEEAMKWGKVLHKANEDMASLGFPNLFGGTSKAPFDVIGDTLRGTQGIMLDMYRQPEKLIEAMEKLVPLMINGGVTAARKTGAPLIFMPLHKGADGFMSLMQFKKFYWPTLRKVILGLVDEGLVPWLFAEGSYNSRLEIVADVPIAKTIWKFDTTDMARAKAILGGIACIEGNVPVSLLTTCSVQEVKDYCMQLIDVAGKDGGFILSNGSVLDKAKPENVLAMIEFTKDYGRYS